MLLCLAGCGDHVRTPTPEEMAAFERAGSITPVVDMDRIEKAKLKTGPYRVVPGDVLEFTMPALLQAVTAAEVQAAQTRTQLSIPYLARVRDNGAIVLPAVGSMTVAGLSLAQIEEQVTDAYKSYIVLHPSVFVRVAEYRTAKVYISGAVRPRAFTTCTSDQMTLSSLLTQAGGISEAGAAVVRRRAIRTPCAETAAGPLPRRPGEGACPGAPRGRPTSRRSQLAIPDLRRYRDGDDGGGRCSGRHDLAAGDAGPNRSSCPWSMPTFRTGIWPWMKGIRWWSSRSRCPCSPSWAWWRSRAISRIRPVRNTT